MAEIPRIKLRSGVEMPRLGFGTFAWSEMQTHGSNFADAFSDAILSAIDAGYRHFDCAQLYCNQRALGKAFAKAMDAGKVKRSELFVVSKVWNTHHEYGRAKEAVNDILEELGLDYVDQLLVHCPMACEYTKLNENFFDFFAPKPTETDYLETWKALEEAVDAGQVRSIGLSNFNSEQVKRVCEHARIQPDVLQIELHPYLSQTKLSVFARKHGLEVVSFSPFMNPSFNENRVGNLFDEDCVKSPAKKYGKTAAQVLLRWQIQHNNIVLCKTNNPVRMVENKNVFDFQLSDNEMVAIDGLDKGHPGGRNLKLEAYSNHIHFPFGIPF